MKSGVIAKPTFFQWLRLHVKDETQLGEIARWILADACWPERSRTVSHMLVHLRSGHNRSRKAPDEVGLRNAFKAYEAFLEAGGTVPKRQRRDDVHRGFLIPRVTIRQIQRLSGRERPQGKTIAVAIQRLYKQHFPNDTELIYSGD